MLRRRSACFAFSLLAALVLAGCPQPQDTTGDSRVNAVIGTSSTTGAPPLGVVFTAVDSSSSYFGPLTYAWDFADGTTSSDVQALHTFAEPGLYRVTLRVTDAGGETGISTVDIRVQGGAVVAVIVADQESGPAPLAVQFDGTQSVVNDDSVRDYRWDFDDGATSVQAKPRHTFRFAGTYEVTLDITTAGGVQASTKTVITVGAAQDSSLQFDGTSFATLTFGATKNLTALTLEAWVKAQSDGGNLLSMGSAATIEVLPSSNLIRTRISGQTFEFAASGLVDTWRHVALVVAPPAGSDPNSTTGSATVYLDGAALGTVNVTATTINASGFIIGNGLRGKLAEVRAWSAARSQSDISGSKNKRITSASSSSIGVWPLNDGAGQTLRNTVAATSGYLGGSSGADAADPAWSSDAPPL